jgi:hypothetical protein
MFTRKNHCRRRKRYGAKQGRIAPHREVSADPFYSESNMKYLREIIADIDAGRVKLTEHDLIEVG